MSALQCSRRLHLEIHRPELAQVSRKTEAIFATGHAVGALAQKLLGTDDGELIDRKPDAEAALQRTIRRGHRTEETWSELWNELHHQGDIGMARTRKNPHNDEREHHPD